MPLWPNLVMIRRVPPRGLEVEHHCWDPFHHLLCTSTDSGDIYILDKKTQETIHTGQNSPATSIIYTKFGIIVTFKVPLFTSEYIIFLERCCTISLSHRFLCCTCGIFTSRNISYEYRSFLQGHGTCKLPFCDKSSQLIASTAGTLHLLPIAIPEKRSLPKTLVFL